MPPTATIDSCSTMLTFIHSWLFLLTLIFFCYFNFCYINFSFCTVFLLGKMSVLFSFLPTFLLFALNKSIAVEFSPCLSPFSLHSCSLMVPWCCGPPHPHQFSSNLPSASACWAFPSQFTVASSNSTCPKAGSSWAEWTVMVLGALRWACGDRSSIPGLWLKLVAGQPQMSGISYWRWAIHSSLGESWGDGLTKAEAPFVYCVCTGVWACVRAYTHLGWG